MISSFFLIVCKYNVRIHVDCHSIAINFQQGMLSETKLKFSMCWQLRLEALSQMSSFLSKMEEKSSDLISPQFSAWLQSVQLQFLSGCFALGTQVISSHTGVNYEMQHYTVLISCKSIIDLIFNSYPLESNWMLFNFTLKFLFLLLFHPLGSRLVHIQLL